ncbi:MAG: ATP-binding protein [Oscillatoria sp. Prado101]|jgi:serine/threonine-protein kinase RsbW|nr:ATP-binding protein [Oscillatoria sp. Prado101]
MLGNLGSWWKEFASGRGMQLAVNARPVKETQLQVCTELTALDDVLRWFDQFNTAPLSCKEWWECETALAEAFTNAVRHAHCELPQTTTIELEVIVFAHCVEMRIWDRGGPFDLEAYIEESLKKPLDPWEIGRKGLRIMKELTDELYYRRTPDGRNCLLMRKIITGE